MTCYKRKNCHNRFTSILALVNMLWHVIIIWQLQGVHKRRTKSRELLHNKNLWIWIPKQVLTDHKYWTFDYLEQEPSKLRTNMSLVELSFRCKYNPFLSKKSSFSAFWVLFWYFFGSGTLICSKFTVLTKILLKIV